MNAFTRRLAITAAAATFLIAVAVASAQPTRATPPQDVRADTSPMSGHATASHDPSAEHGGMPEMMQHHRQMMMQMHGGHGTQMEMRNRAMSGQDAFGAIQNVVAGLDADPGTDWSKVNLEALRQHLIDMNEVTLKADAAATPIDGGLAITVTGSGRTLAAIQRMVPAHAQEINGLDNWRVNSEAIANGVLLTVTANDPKQVQRIQGRGFIGILVSGSHHQPHHLAIARGEFPHAH